MTEVVKTYPGSSEPVIDLQEFRLAPGQQLALRGRSGSGKSTLLNLIAGMLSPDRGRILIDGCCLGDLSESQRDRLRGQKLGYVFQSFHLLQGLTVWENLWLAAALSGAPDSRRLESFLERLDLQERRNHKPSQLSIGQQQRVAVARALVHRPRLVLADEPTGNLDAELAGEALALMRQMCQESEAALLLVSHDPAVLGQFPECRDLAELKRGA